MKEEVRQLLTNAGMMASGIYIKFQFTNVKYKFRQLIAFVVAGSMCVWLVHLINIKAVYQNGICFVLGIWMVNIIRALVKAGNQNEDKLAKKISKKIEDNL